MGKSDGPQPIGEILKSALQGIVQSFQESIDGDPYRWIFNRALAARAPCGIDVNFWLGDLHVELLDVQGALKAAKEVLEEISNWGDGGTLPKFRDVLQREISIAEATLKPVAKKVGAGARTPKACLSAVHDRGPSTHGLNRDTQSGQQGILFRVAPTFYN